MAIHYFRDHVTVHRSRNFGDDVNPFLLGAIFPRALIDSPTICLIGIGTILNDALLDKVTQFRRKIVFSSGVGYGAVSPHRFDDSWQFSCVRGPHSAEKLALPAERAICDGAILLRRYFAPLPESRRAGIVFIPHINTSWVAGQVLGEICTSLRMRYLSPDCEETQFIDGVRAARLVITEAMHGAILADTMRVPWIATRLYFHEAFKWRDWFASLELPYRCEPLKPSLWNAPGGIVGLLKRPYQRAKTWLLRARIRAIAHETRPNLSCDRVLEDRIARLDERIDEIKRSWNAAVD